MSLRLPAAALVLLLGLIGCSGCAGPSLQTPPGPMPLVPTESTEVTSERPLVQDGVFYEQGDATRDGIGKFYMGREIAKVMGHRGAAWLERPDRAREERPDLLVNALDLAPNAVVADLGAGTGYFTFRLAPLVPTGKVIAVDIQREMLQIIAGRAEVENATNVEVVQGTITDPGLDTESVDLTLIVDAYHEFSHPREMLTAIRDATRPGGQLVLVEYRGEDPSIPIKRLHTMTEAQAILEAESAGWRFVENRDVLPQQHLLVFEKP
ncbi:MAG: class I SAM-dependent methyltransferase [Bacteroidota bacterium]